MRAPRESILPKDEDVAQYDGLPFFLDAPHRYSKEDYKYLTTKSKWPKPTKETIVPSDYLFVGQDKYAYFNDIPGAQIHVRN